MIHTILLIAQSGRLPNESRQEVSAYYWTQQGTSYTAHTAAIQEIIHDTSGFQSVKCDG